MRTVPHVAGQALSIGSGHASGLAHQFQVPKCPSEHFSQHERVWHIAALPELASVRPDLVINSKDAWPRGGRPEPQALWSASGLPELWLGAAPAAPPRRRRRASESCRGRQTLQRCFASGWKRLIRLGVPQGPRAGLPVALPSRRSALGFVRDRAVVAPQGAIRWVSQKPDPPSDPNTPG